MPYAVTLVSMKADATVRALLAAGRIINWSSASLARGQRPHVCVQRGPLLCQKLSVLLSAGWGWVLSDRAKVSLLCW